MFDTIPHAFRFRGAGRVNPEGDFNPSLDRITMVWQTTLALVVVAGGALAAAAEPGPAPPPVPAPRAAAPPRETVPPASVALVEQAIRVAMSRLGIPGLSIALVLGPDRSWAAGYGRADLEKNIPATEGTIYRLASISKTVTAVAALQLADDGKLDLDAPVQTYVPGFPRKLWPVTSRHLLTHQSGLRHWSAEEWAQTRHFTTLAAAVELFKDDPLLFEPGTLAAYSSVGYTLLGRVVEGASGQEYLAYVRKNVFARAGMRDARDDDALAIIPRRTAGYAKDQSGHLRHSVRSDTSGKLPAGGLLATAPDLARFGGALLRGELVAPATVTRMCTAQTTRNGHLVSTGLGPRVTHHRGQLECWQQGAQPEVSGLLYLRPSRGVSLAILCNLEGVPEALLDLARQIADVVTAAEPSRRN
jgi:CubicO group peptidase (beta-lactamase class C family)